MLLEEYSGQTALYTAKGESQKVNYLTRIDPFTGNVAKISEQRARRAIGITTELRIQPIENCVFCAFEEHTPKKRISHSCGAVSVPNMYPWEKYDWITIYPPFSRHKLFLSDIHFEDLERMMESSYDLAEICARDPDVIAFMDFTNWGAFAGASQQHPHSQRKSVTKVPSPGIYNEMRRCYHLREQMGQNPFDRLEREERIDGTRIIYDGDIFIVAMFAPSCPEEILVFPKENIAHILQMTGEERKKIIQPVMGIFPALFFCRGITDLNIAVHMAPFDEMEAGRKYYRWHMHIYPRRGRLPADRAGAEIGFRTGVIDTLPEVTAQVIRGWYKNGPNGEMLAKTSDGCPDPELMEVFHNFCRGTGDTTAIV